MAKLISATGDDMKARPTIYKGIKMRSRLEAQFASHLDRRGFNWEYEPTCFANEHSQYLPDFKLVSGTEVAYIDIKPTKASAELLMQSRKMEVIWASEPHSYLLAMWYHAVEYDRAWRWKGNYPCTSWKDILDRAYSLWPYRIHSRTVS